MLAASARQLRYLIVDDSPISLKWLQKTLEMIGPCEIVQASDGREALQALEEEGDRIDAIISDLRMPNTNGLELLKEVRMARSGVRQCVPFFVVTGFADRAVAGLALGLDVDAFLARPVKKQALERHIMRTTAERRIPKKAAEAMEAYVYVDLSLTAFVDEDEPLEPADNPAARVSEPGDAQGSAAHATEELIELKRVPEGARLARDAINGMGAVLLKAGEEMTASLKAVLMSYAEIDDSLSKVWVSR